MKYLFVIDSLASGGAQRLFVQLACELVKLGHSVDVFVYDTSDFYDDDFLSAGVRITRVNRTGNGFSLSVLLRLIQEYKFGYSQVFSAMYGPSFYAVMASVKLFLWKYVLNL